MNFLTDERGSLAYTVSGDGPPVVLLHAGVADHQMWDAVLPALTGYTVIRYDLRGYGASPAPTGGYRDALDLQRLLDHLGHARVRLVGASWGGRVAVEFTAERPDRVHSLAVLAPPADFAWSAEVKAYGAAEGAALEAGDLDLAVRINLDMWLRGPAREWDDLDPALVARLAGPLHASLVHQQSRDEHGEEGPEPELARIAVPTLVGSGRWDVADFQEIATGYAAGIPGAEFVEFDAGHLIALEVPEELSAVLVEFLAR